MDFQQFNVWCLIVDNYDSHKNVHIKNLKTPQKWFNRPKVHTEWSFPLNTGAFLRTSISNLIFNLHFPVLETDHKGIS